MKLSSQLVVSSLAVFVLSACSSNPADRRQAKDDFEYLDTPSLKEWSVPEGTQPNFYPNFDIPSGDFNGGIGKNVDIRPPQQVLDLIPGARSEYKDGEVTMWMVKEDELDKVWQVTKNMLKNQQITLLNESESSLETNWVSWKSEDEDVIVGSRYSIERFESNRRFGFKISLIDWKEGSRVLPVSQTNKERYNVLMTNLVTSTYDNNLRREAELKAQQLVKRIPISMGKDRSGLPVIIARGSYDTLWRHMPTILPKMGFTIEDRNQSQGVISVKYFERDNEFWQKVGTKPLDISESSYTFLMGDLDNRTSINVTDSKGKPISEELLSDIVPMLTAMMEENAKLALIDDDILFY